MGWFSRATPSLWAPGERKTFQEVHGMCWKRPFGKSSMSYLERRWSSPVIITDPHLPRPFNMKDDIILLSEGNRSNLIKNCKMKNAKFALGFVVIAGLLSLLYF